MQGCAKGKEQMRPSTEKCVGAQPFHQPHRGASAAHRKCATALLRLTVGLDEGIHAPAIAEIYRRRTRQRDRSRPTRETSVVIALRARRFGGRRVRVATLVLLV